VSSSGLELVDAEGRQPREEEIKVEPEGQEEQDKAPW
jgi:hypothetical protein